ncbi:putative CTTNBP2 N-terminal-like protein isoform X2 [Pseudomonas phage HU1]|nr:putative CTTNBP2 N-terminal-like protein isoform X2 [Pseudomonas phage HU1]
MATNNEGITMSEENELAEGQRRLFQMNDNLEFRVSQLESERLPSRVQQVEFIAGQLQGEMTAIKEISRGIGIKLDSGIQELKSENIRNQSFIKGVLWIGGIISGIFALGPVLGEIVKKLLGLQ